jgi:hypothetical protein
MSGFRELLKRLKDDKKRIVINGMGTGDTKGTILEVHDDYIEYELLEIKTEKKAMVEKRTREVKCIPVFDIHDVSEGEVETEKPLGLGSFAGKKEGGK